MQHTSHSEPCRIASLTARAVLRVTGEDTEKLLQGLVTNSVARLGEERAVFAALLTPQGKILADFFLVKDADRVLIEAPAALLNDLAKRLALYKLRAKAVIEPQPNLTVLAAWGGQRRPEFAEALVYGDPRLTDLGWRVIVDVRLADAMIAASGCHRAVGADYQRHRIELAIPEGGRDYAYGDAFPHEAALDQLNGIDFRKGCYVGQEIVSRMEHRGTARTRIVSVEAELPLPSAGSALSAGETPVGTLGSVAGPRGIGLVRLDRAAKAMAAGVPVTAAGLVVRVSIPAWARYGFPEVSAQPERE